MCIGLYQNWSNSVNLAQHMYQSLWSINIVVVHKPTITGTYVTCRHIRNALSTHVFCSLRYQNEHVHVVTITVYIRIYNCRIS